ncbi:MAG: MFS transporter [Bacillota bacterium]|nr:MFS transporter [Bacillota bacterium]
MHIRIIDQYRGLPRPVYILAIARVIVATGTFVFPFLTMFLSSRLSMNDQEVSGYLLLVALAQLPASMLGGKLADRFPRKKVYGLGLFLSIFFFALSGFFCHSRAVVFLILGGYFFSNLCHPILSAMIIDVSRPETRQESYSLVYLGFNLGYSIGPLIAALLFEKYISWIFWGQAIMVSLAVLLILLFIPGKALQNSEAAPASPGEPVEKSSLWKLLRRDKLMLIFAACMICYAFSYAQTSYLLPLNLELVQGISQAAKSNSLVWSCNGLVVCLAAPLVVMLTKKNSTLFNCALGLLFCALGFGGSALIGEKNALLLFLVFLWTVGEILCNTNSGLFIAGQAPLSHRARYQSIYDVIQSLGKATGPIIMGLFLLKSSYQQGWLLVGGLCLLAAFVLLKSCRLKNPGRSGQEAPPGSAAPISTEA